MPNEALLFAKVQRMAFDPALERMIKPSTPSMRILLRAPRASSSTARSETLKIAAPIALVMPSFTSLASAEQIGRP